LKLLSFKNLKSIGNKVSVGRSERWRPLGRYRRKWKDNIKMDLKGMGWGGMNWIALA